MSHQAVYSVVRVAILGFEAIPCPVIPLSSSDLSGEGGNRAPVKAYKQHGESLCRGKQDPVAEGNCVAAKRGGADIARM